MPQLDALVHQKQALLNSNQPIRARNAAEKIGITEAQYVALSIGDSVDELDMQSVVDLFDRLASCGELMALTRNSEVVMERKGLYHAPKLIHDALILVNKDINLRLRINDWRYGFAVNENGRQSLQFFGADGMAAHKIYATDLTHKVVFQRLIARFKLPENKPRLLEILNPELSQTTIKNPLNTDAQILQPEALKQLFHQIAEQQLPIMLLVPNQFATQVFTGRIHKLLETGPWFNVLDPGFDLHMNLAGINQAWLITQQSKPIDSHQSAQATHSVEFFNSQSEVVMVVNLAPETKKSLDLNARWQTLLQSLIC